MSIEYEFDEASYLRDNPDVKKAKKWAKFESGKAHFQNFGQKEGRVPNPGEIKFQFNLDAAFLAKSGFFVANGWIDTYRKIVSHVTFQIGFLKVKVPVEDLMRSYRPDVSEFLGDQKMRISHGFLFFMALPSKALPVDKVQMFVSNTYASNEKEFPLKISNTSQMLDNTMSLLHHSTTSGTPLVVVESFLRLYEDVVDQTWSFVVNNQKKSRVTNIGSVEPNTPEFSVITILYNNHNLLSAQSVLLFKDLQANGAEIIIGNNSPEISNSLQQQARVLNKTYGIRFTIIDIGNNIGFSKANNIGAEVARSERLLFINPDVMPSSEQETRQLISSVKSVENKQLLGTVWYYGDGSIMHGGMAVLEDDFIGSSELNDSEHTQRILRVDHYLKGAPPEMLEKLTKHVPVEAITGALMIIRKEYFQMLGGFSEEFMFGHYEDADLCLRVWQDGGEVLLDPKVRLYHFEGHGSGNSGAHMKVSQHINRLKFTKKWLNTHTETTSEAIDIQKLITQDSGAAPNE